MFGLLFLFTLIYFNYFSLSNDWYVARIGSWRLAHQARAYKVGIHAASEIYARSAMISSWLRRAVCDPAPGARVGAEPFHSGRLS